MLPEQLRLTMRQWATGVTVVTGRAAGQIHGMTVNSFTSVSLDPPLVTVTLARRTRTFTLVNESGFFTVSILSAGQAEIAERFAGKVSSSEDRFVGLELYTLVSGAPLIAGGVAGLDCRLIAEHPVGDSNLLIGAVMDVRVENSRDPLIYYQRGYHRMERDE